MKKITHLLLLFFVFNYGNNLLNAQESDSPFVTTWKTDNPLFGDNQGMSVDNQITIPTHPDEIYNYNVDWGDGTTDSGVTESISHTYDIAGVYKVSIYGDFPHIYFNNSGDDRAKLIEINQWGSIKWLSMENAFSGCYRMDVIANDTPDLSKVTSLARMFKDCSRLKGNTFFNDWDVSSITNMAFVFSGAHQFNQDIGNWNVANVTNMSSIFNNIIQFNQDISNWDVSNVINMNSMFQSADNFNQDISSWDVSSVTNMSSMFLSSGLSQENYDALLSGWSSLPSLQNRVVLGADTINYCRGESGRQKLINDYGWTITDDGLSEDCELPVHDGRPFITTWETDNNKVTITTNPDLAYNYTIHWGDGSVDINVTGTITHNYSSRGVYKVSISGVFPHFYNKGRVGVLKSVNQWGDIVWESMESSFAGFFGSDLLATDIPNLSNVTSMKNMFLGNEFVSQINESFSNWDVSNVIDMSGMFSRRNLTSFNADITGWDVSNVVNMSNMFSSSPFNQDISNWDVSNVTDMSNMFRATSFNQDISSWDVSNVTNMSGMFDGGSIYIGSSSFNQDISSWDVSNVTDMSFMFYNTPRFNQDISSWDVSNVTNMGSMFAYSFQFNQDIGSWDVSSVTNMSHMFTRAKSFNQDIGNWNVSNVTNMVSMFAGGNTEGPLVYSSFNQDISNWDVSNVTNMRGMFSLGSLSQNNYDTLLLAWSSLPSLKTGVRLDVDTTNFCLGAEGRQKLINEYEWIIIDDGINGDCESAAHQGRPFITTWETNNFNQIAIPTNPDLTYNYTVHWGDGNIDVNVTGTITHNYSSRGVYEVSISGVFPHFYNMGGLNSSYLKSVNQWGDIEWKSMERSFELFADFSSINFLATDIPNLSNVTSMASMFAYNSSSSFNESISSWDVSNVTNMSNMFYESSFNQNISDWDVGNVTNMRAMFQRTNFNQDIGSWDVSSVTDMNGMFDTGSLSQDNYDALLLGWSSLPSLETGIRLDVDTTNFCLGEEGRQKLIDEYGWSFSDGGKALDCVIADTAIFNFILVDADSNIDLFEITEGMEISLASLPTSNLTVRAEASLGTESVFFNLTGPRTLEHTENVIPYALYGDNANGTDYVGTKFAAGNYSLSATPFSEAYMLGEQGIGLSVDFKIVETPYFINKYILVDADNDTDLFEITDGMEINLASLPTSNLTIRAEASLETESVFFNLTGPRTLGHTENVIPYALFGDNANGTDYVGSILSTGNYTLLSTAFSEAFMGGVKGASLSVDFTIINNSSVISLLAKGVEFNTPVMSVYPNPVIDSEVNASFNVAIELKEILLYDTSGKLIQRFNPAEVKDGGEYVMPLTYLQSGSYFMLATDILGNVYQKQLIVK